MLSGSLQCEKTESGFCTHKRTTGLGFLLVNKGVTWLLGIMSQIIVAVDGDNNK